MAKGHHKDNLTKARKLQHNTPDNKSNSQPSENSESDCGYEGEVNCDSTDDEYDPTDDLDDGWSSDESLAELEGDELEANLQALHKEAKSWNAPTAFKVMMAPKDANDWKKAEANRTLGYTKNSTRTQERRRKEEREQTAFQAKAKTS
jgi:hypothetical protein